MASKAEKERQKPYQDRCQRLLNEMLKDEDNKYCVDCDAKGPRWASWNLGIFLCIRCAGIHRNLGVHISKVKSVNLDSWTPQQVVSLQQMGNSRARAVYEANLPDNFRRPQTENSLEAFIRAKYEQKKYIAREWVPPQLPKVNWDKELEEEAQRYRKKKREIKQTLLPSPINVANPISSSCSSSVPKPLPKPQSLQSSPRASRNSPSHSTDLLELDTPTNEVPSHKNNLSDSDLLTNFLNSDDINSTNSASSTKMNRTAEEDSFFNQSSASTNNDKKLTKDSILALYGNPVTYSPLGMQTQSFSGHLNGGTNVYPPQSNSPNPAGRFVPQGGALGFNPFYTMAVAQSSQNGSSVVGNMDGNTRNDLMQQKMFSMNLNDRNVMQGPKQEKPSTQQINALSSTLTTANLFH